jgi:hypothetical protein
MLGLLVLAPTCTIAGPITFGNSTASAVPGWISPLVPSDALMADSAPFTFAEADGAWDLLAEQAVCGDNRIGWTTPASSAPPIIIFDGADTPGTLRTPPEAIAFTYQVGDDGAIWTSAGAGDYLHFTLLQVAAQVAADEDTYYLGMTADCASEVGGEATGDGLPGAGEPREGGSVSSSRQALQNYVLIRITLRRTSPPPQSAGSVWEPPLSSASGPEPPLSAASVPPPPPAVATVPEPGTLGLIGTGVVAMWMRRRRVSRAVRGDL